MKVKGHNSYKVLHMEKKCSKKKETTTFEFRDSYVVNYRLNYLFDGSKFYKELAEIVVKLGLESMITHGT